MAAVVCDVIRVVAEFMVRYESLVMGLAESRVCGRIHGTKAGTVQ